MKSCVYCHTDNTSVIIRSYTHTIVALAQEPYNDGHIILVPKRHYESLNEISQEVYTEITALIGISSKILYAVMEPQGINIGLNVGSAVTKKHEKHLVFHILPRWLKDTNSLVTIGNIKVIFSDLEKVKKQYEKSFPVSLG